MAQTGFTPIQLYSSSTATNVPLAANLATGELAINITDGKLFYKDNAAAVQVIGWKVVPATAGGTGQTSYAIGDLLYADTTTTLAKLADVATGNALISGGIGVAPSWGKVGLTTHVSGTLPVANGGTNASSASITAFNNITGYSASGATGTTSTNLVFSAVPTFGTTIGVGGATAAASGAGVTFPATQSASSDANTLDDYEEGTFTPTLEYSGTNTPTYIVQTGRYTKVGRIVQIQILLVWNENGSTGNLLFTNLPFTSVTSNGRAAVTFLSFGLLIVTSSITGYVVSNATSILPVINDNTGTQVSATNTDNDQDVYMTVTYEAA